MNHQDLQGNEIGDGQKIYKTPCLDGTCLLCGSLQLLSTCEHMDSTHAIENEIVDYGKYKTVTYAPKDEKYGKRCDLVIAKIPIYDFMKIFLWKDYLQVCKAYT